MVDALNLVDDSSVASPSKQRQLYTNLYSEIDRRQLVSFFIDIYKKGLKYLDQKYFPSYDLKQLKVKNAI